MQQERRRLFPQPSGGTVGDERLAARFERLREITGEISLLRLAVQKLSSGGRLVLEPRRTPVQRSGLPMRSHGRCPRGRNRRVPQDRFRIFCRLCVVGESNHIRCTTRRTDERRKRAGVKRDSPIRRKRFLDRQACELVPKRDAVLLRREDAGAEALFELGRGELGHRRQQPELRSTWDDGGGVEQGLGRLAQAGRAREHRVAHRLWKLSGTDGPASQ